MPRRYRVDREALETLDQIRKHVESLTYHARHETAAGNATARERIEQIRTLLDSAEEQLLDEHAEANEPFNQETADADGTEDTDS